VANYAFSLPAHVGVSHLTRPFVVQRFESDKLKVTVIYSETPSRAIRVNYTLSIPWTQEQINATLKANGSRLENRTTESGVAFSHGRQTRGCISQQHRDPGL
jgi:hypothetical protein